MTGKKKREKNIQIDLIAIFLFFASGFPLMSVLMLLLGMGTGPDGQPISRDSIPVLDLGLTAMINVGLFIGSIALYRQRKLAFYLMVVSFVAILVKLGQILFVATTSEGGAATATPLIWGMLLMGSLALCFFTFKLTRTGVLT